MASDLDSVGSRQLVKGNQMMTQRCLKSKSGVTRVRFFRRRIHFYKLYRVSEEAVAQLRIISLARNAISANALYPNNVCYALKQLESSCFDTAKLPASKRMQKFFTSPYSCVTAVTEITLATEQARFLCICEWLWKDHGWRDRLPNDEFQYGISWNSRTDWCICGAPSSVNTRFLICRSL